MAKGAKLKKMANVLLNVVLVISILMIVFTIIVRVAGNNPSIGGLMLYRVSSESMEPELMVGDIILSKKVTDVSALEIGDVVTYQGTVGSYAGKMITHEVVIPPYKQGDKYYLLTMGIANDAADPVISEDQVESKMIFKLPFFGVIYSFFITPWGLITSIILIIVVFAAEFRRIRKIPLLEEFSDEDNEYSPKYIPRHLKD